METMASKNLSVFLTAILALTVFAASASAAVHFESVEIDGIYTDGLTDIAVSAGQTVPVRVAFNASTSEEDVRVKAWVSGDKSLAVATDRFDVLEGRRYTKAFNVVMPYNIDPSEDLFLFLTIETRDGEMDHVEIPLTVQRESYVVEMLDILMDARAKAGDVVPVDIVLKNRGSHEATDTFVAVRIPELGIETRAYFGDLSAVDQGDDGDHPEMQDSAERRVFLKLPADAPAGVYTVEFETFNADSQTTMQKKLLITGAAEDSQIVVPSTSKTITVDGKASYTVTLVNRGSTLRVYEFAVEQPEGLSVDVSEPVVVVPAGGTRTVKIDTAASKPGTYSFALTVTSDSKVVQAKTFSTTVEGAKTTQPTFSTGNTTVLLTVILAIVFVVLLVVLIVLLTRKPAKSEEYGESYY